MSYDSKVMSAILDEIITLDDVMAANLFNTQSWVNDHHIRIVWLDDQLCEIELQKDGKSVFKFTSSVESTDYAGLADRKANDNSE